MFRIRQPKDRGGSNKPVSFLQTPRDFAEFKVMQDLLRQKVMKKIGYEAALAHVVILKDLTLIFD